jgi:predicted RNase H-like nuclease
MHVDKRAGAVQINAMLPESGLVLGIDIGWSVDKKTTAASVLEWSQSELTITTNRLPTDDRGRRAELDALVGQRSIHALAVDGPIRGALDEIGIYRDAEMILTRQLGGYIGKPGQSSSGNGRKLNAAANSIVRLVLETGRVISAVHAARIHEYAIAEAFPTSFLGVMLDAGAVPLHGARSDAYFAHLLGPHSPNPPPPSSDRLLGLLERLLPGRRLASGTLAAVRDHEERAAVVCAITALCVAVGEYVAVGDTQNGYIILPPRADDGAPGLQPWAWRIISGNQPTAAIDSVISEPK